MGPARTLLSCSDSPEPGRRPRTGTMTERPIGRLLGQLTATPGRRLLAVGAVADLRVALADARGGRRLELARPGLRPVRWRLVAGEHPSRLARRAVGHVLA